MRDLIGPSTSADHTTIRPQRASNAGWGKGSSPTWHKGCSANGSGDGTEDHQDWRNDMQAQLSEAIDFVLTPAEISDVIADTSLISSNRFAGDFLLAACFKKMMGMIAALTPTPGGVDP